MKELTNSIEENELDFDHLVSDENIPERRKNTRAPRQEAKGQLYYQLKLDKIGKKTFETLLGKSIFLIVVTCSLVLLTWEINFRLALIDNNAQKNNENTLLISELKELHSQWSDDDLKQIEVSIKQAESKIFESIPKLADWLSYKSSNASELGFNLKYLIGASRSVDVDGTFSMPVDFDLISLKTTKNVYAKSLEFIRDLINENRRLEISSIEVKADKSGITHFSLSVNVWVKDPNRIISLDDKGGADNDAEFIQ